MELSSLSNSSIQGLAAAVSPPGYDRSALTPSIVHIGVGGFHRSHLATYVDELCRAGNTDWAILGAGVLPGDATMAEALHGQDTLFTVIERGAESTRATVVGSMIGYTHAYPDPTALVAAIAAPSTQIVSLTVTEGGYPVDDASGDFDAASPNAGAGSAFALVAAGLQQRMSDGGGPLTVMSCDNIMANGAATRTATVGMAEQLDHDLVGWIGDNVAFPNSMVDRITPATSDDDRTWLAETHGIADAWPVACEPFRQWVIEDDFAGARPPFEDLDIIITEDVRPYEHMKLQLLNAGHSCLAYGAALLGIEFVHDAMADDDIRTFVRAFLDQEAKTSLAPVPGLDVDEYIEILIDRFSNPQIRDQVSRLCQDGSGKLPKFLLPTVRTHLEGDGPTELSGLLLATWCQYLLGTTEDGAPLELANDPLADAATAAASASVADPTSFLDLDPVFDEALRNNSTLRRSFERALVSIRTNGLRLTIRNAAGGLGVATRGGATE